VVPLASPVTVQGEVLHVCVIAVPPPAGVALTV
jgi:hypothetical protein